MRVEREPTQLTRFESLSRTALRLAGSTILVWAGLNLSPSDHQSAPVNNDSTPAETTTSTLPLVASVPGENVNALPPVPADIELETKPGDVIAKMRIPRLCGLETDILQLALGESARVGLDSSIDKLIPEDAVQADCEEGLLHAEAARKANPAYAARSQRTNRNYPFWLDLNNNARQDEGDVTKPKANNFVPLLGHWPATPRLGENGNAVLFGHRTTASAPLALIDMLKVGDEIIAGSGRFTFTYLVSGLELVSAEDEKAATRTILFPPGYDRENIDNNEPTLTIFACEPQRDDSFRIVIRAKLVDRVLGSKG